MTGTLKFINTLLLAVFAVLAMASCVKEIDPSASTGDQIIYIDERYVEPAVVRIKLKEQADPGDAASLLNSTEPGLAMIAEIAGAYGATEVRRTFTDGGRFSKRRREAGLHLWYDIHIDPNASLSRAITDLDKLSSIAIVEPVGKVYQTVVRDWTNDPSRIDVARLAAGVVDDPGLDNQWHYHNAGTLAQALPGADINVVPAWEITTGHRDIIVAIIDSGLDYLHEDLAANMWVNEAELNGTAGMDDDNNGYVDDVYGYNFYRQTGEIDPGEHGTHVGGTVGAVNNNNTGVAGVAGGDGSGNGVRLMSCQNFVNGDAKNSAEAFLYAADNGAVIAQCSWEVYAGSEALHDAVRYFVNNAGFDENGNQTGPLAGGLVVVAAGNAGLKGVYAPASYSETFVVASMGAYYQKALYTNYGESIDVTAPGGTSSEDGDRYGVYSTMPDNGYGYFSGTSMASPHVSGVAALVISKYGVGQTGFTADMLKGILAGTANPVIYQYNSGMEGLLGTGMVDAARALSVDKRGDPDNIEQLYVDTRSATPQLTFTVPADVNGLPVLKYTIVYSMSDLRGIADGALPSDAVTMEFNSTAAVGAEASVPIRRLTDGQTYNFAVRGTDIYGYSTQWAFFDGYRHIRANTAPRLIERLPNVTLVGAGATTRIDLGEYFIDDNDNDTITYSVQLPEGDLVTASMEGTVLVLKAAKYGYGLVTVTARDYQGLTADDVLKVISTSSDAGVVIYPGTADDAMMVIGGEGFSGEAIMDIFNSAGQKVSTQELSLREYQYARFWVPGLNMGAYSVKIRTPYRTFSGNFMKTK